MWTFNKLNGAPALRTTCLSSLMAAMVWSGSTACVSVARQPREFGAPEILDKAHGTALRHERYRPIWADDVSQAANIGHGEWYLLEDQAARRRSDKNEETYLVFDWDDLVASPARIHGKKGLVFDEALCDSAPGSMSYLLEAYDGGLGLVYEDVKHSHFYFRRYYLPTFQPAAVEGSMAVLAVRTSPLRVADYRELRKFIRQLSDS